MATQQERRQNAIARLLDAAIETIAEVGYPSATAAAITRRAGLSHGALFRHFPTMSEFMVATALETLDRQVAEFVAKVADVGEDADLGAILTIVREVVGSRTNTVMYELVNAARTDPDLAEVMRAHNQGYLDMANAAARSVPALRGVPEDLLGTLLLMVTDMFDAEAMLRSVRPLTEDETGRRDQILALLYATLLNQTTSKDHS